MSDTPQSNFQNNQNFEPDIVEMFKHFVTGSNSPGDNETGENVGIDDLRGQISITVTGQTTKNLISSLNISPTSTTPSNTPDTSTPVLLAQESRCHAFFRIIGFPVINSSKNAFYNPGLDVVKIPGLTRKLTLSNKIQIASNIDPKFESLSQARETYVNNTLHVFNVPESVEAGVLSLMSGTYGNKGNPNLRSFTSNTFSNGDDPFDFVSNNQVNQISIFSASSLVGEQEILLSDFQDANGVKPNAGITNPSVFQQHLHVIKPFMVDPRIDFSIWANESRTSSGLSKRVAVPFVPDANFLKANSTSYCERPLIEKIITERFSQFNNTIDAGQATTDLVTYVKDVKSIQNVNIGTVTISQIFSNSIFKLSEQAAFAQYLSIIQAMMVKLVKSIHVIHAAQGTHYWLPAPSNLGPEGGVSIRAVPLNQNVSTELLTPQDFNIAYNQAQVLLSNITASTSQANTTPDKGGFAFNAFFNHKLTFDSSTSNSQGDISSQTMDTLAAKRNKILTRAGEALQVVEMIMGEYSGLGLCDIIAIVGALYIMPKGDLLGLLDDDAIIRAELILNQSLQGQRSNITTAMDSLTKTVKGFYQIMDKIFQDQLNNNALNL
jgi:hypothetical protein